jgi:hypothetical protein
MADRPPISVILATSDPWPDLARCLEALEPQVSDLGGELIVGDAHGGALQADRVAKSRCLVWIPRPGASVFDLRALAAERARGEVVAATEDHCVVAPDWCAEIIRGFALNPGALALTGPVLNGAGEHLIDRANYLHTFGGLVPPCDLKRRGRCPPNANVAYRRGVIPAGPVPPGWLELDLNPRLFGQGQFAFHEGMTLTHVQSFGFWKTLRAHFDNGRSTTGLHPVRLSRRQLPWRVYRGSVRTLSERQQRDPEVRASLPLLFLLSCCHALGETAGIIAGPGRSPARLR